MFRLCSLSNQKFARSSVWSVLKIVVRKFVIVKVQFNGPRTSYSSIFRQEDFFWATFYASFLDLPPWTPGCKSLVAFMSRFSSWDFRSPKKCDKTRNPHPAGGGGTQPLLILRFNLPIPKRGLAKLHHLKGKPTHGLINWQEKSPFSPFNGEFWQSNSLKMFGSWNFALKITHNTKWTFKFISVSASPSLFSSQKSKKKTSIQTIGKNPPSKSLKNRPKNPSQNPTKNIYPTKSQKKTIHHRLPQR